MINSWTPVDHLPPMVDDDCGLLESDRLLVWVEGNGVAFGRVRQDLERKRKPRWSAEGYLGTFNIVFWQPLPDRPIGVYE